MKVEFEIYRETNGIETTITVATSVLIVPPWRGGARSAPSEADYYGYTEVEIIESSYELTDSEKTEAEEQALDIASET